MSFIEDGAGAPTPAISHKEVAVGAPPLGRYYPAAQRARPRRGPGSHRRHPALRWVA